MKIPLLGLGTWDLLGSKCKKTTRLALEIGYRHIDTASIYENEMEVAEGIEGFPREELFLTTKLWNDIDRPEKVEKACDLSLQRLRTSYVDLYLLHWPNKETFIDLLGAMEQLKRKGKVKEIGISNAAIHHLEDSLRAKIPVAMNQVEFHPFLYQKELLDFCIGHKIGITAYCPLARTAVFKNKVLQEVGKKHEKTAGQAALRWLYQKGIVVIPKASSKKHLSENYEIFDFNLSDEEMAAIDALNENRRIIAPKRNEFSY